VNLKEKLLDADVSLGLFLSDTPEKFGTVILDENDEFVECEDKPLVPRSKWIWGAMAFRKTFVCVSKLVSRENEEVQVADMLNKAKQIGLKVTVSKYLDGQYHDVGTLENLLEYMKRNIRISSIESNK
jgi:dTDP-glucose pyrophosphorylase